MRVSDRLQAVPRSTARASLIRFYVRDQVPVLMRGWLRCACGLGATALGLAALAAVVGDPLAKGLATGALFAAVSAGLLAVYRGVLPLFCLLAGLVFVRGPGGLSFLHGELGVDRPSGPPITTAAVRVRMRTVFLRGPLWLRLWLWLSGGGLAGYAVAVAGVRLDSAIGRPITTTTGAVALALAFALLNGGMPPRPREHGPRAASTLLLSGLAVSAAVGAASPGPTWTIVIRGAVVLAGLHELLLSKGAGSSANGMIASGYERDVLLFRRASGEPCAVIERRSPWDPRFWSERNRLLVDPEDPGGLPGWGDRGPATVRLARAIAYEFWGSPRVHARDVRVLVERVLVDIDPAGPHRLAFHELERIVREDHAIAQGVIHYDPDLEAARRALGLGHP